MEHMTKLEIKGNLLEHRSRAVTTLLHLQEISTRDLGMRRGRGRRKDELKLSYFFDKQVELMNLEDCKGMNNGMRHKLEFKGNLGSTSVEKRRKT